MIATWTEGHADEHMDEAILVELGSAVRRHPWWMARARLTIGVLERAGLRPHARVLDAGCGWGVTLEALERRGYKVTGLDVSRRALDGLDRPDRELVVADLTQPLPGSVTPFDAVLALDVIEHLDDDREAVARLGELARPGGGVVVVSVPARPDLFSEFDEVQGHRRRYLPETLRAAFQGTGLELESIFWWGAWLEPMLRRRRSRRIARTSESPARTYARYLRLPPWPGPWVLRAGFALEHSRALGQRLGTGTSLFAVARRP
jgi:2-polyprenyl-3-methyl-5-hydroxy-6-metoxy-1,4-benzoquinol methylase